jgi:geranylgeranyl reductase family protein
MSVDADVIVAGAGPAGATAARTLAAAGLRTLIVERAAMPRNKPCGGGISARVTSRFPYLRDALTCISVHWISKLLLEGPSGGVFEMTSPRPAVLMIRRVEFDHRLVQLALEAGAELLAPAAVGQVEAHDAGVTLTLRDGRRLTAPMVVAADGVNSVIARRLGINPGWPASRLALDMMEETPAALLRSSAPDTLHVFYGYGGAHGYAYVFPKREHVNAGIGYLLSYFRARVDAVPYELQQRFIADLTTRGVLAGDSQRDHFTPFLIPVGGPLRRTTFGRVLLAGDAGGFVNGFSAEGIYYAMVTGELAGRAIVEARRGGAIDPADARRQYERAWRREIGTELRDSVILQRYLFHSPARMDAVVGGARAHPSLAQLLVDYATGVHPYRTARRRLLFHSPRRALRLTRLAWSRAASL